MEFLMTYGWAFLVVLIVVGALVYIGVLNPKRFLPQRIDFGPGIHVPDYSLGAFNSDSLDIGTFMLIIKNALGKDMNSVTLSVLQCENGAGKKSEPIDIRAGETEKIVLACENLGAIVGDENSYDVTLEYSVVTDGNIVAHTESAKMKATADKLKDFPDDKAGRRSWALEFGASGKNDANRFYPCDDVPGCTNPDPSGTLKKVFGGYVDSMTGIVWLSHDGPGLYTWSEKKDAWDKVQLVWDKTISEYYFPEEDFLSFRNDDIGTAFEYCTGLTEYGYSDWKLPSSSDFDSGMLDCSECLPPKGTYPPQGILAGKYYWTEELSTDGVSKCVPFIPDAGLDLIISCGRDDFEQVRCVRSD